MKGNTSIRYPVLYLQHGGGEDKRVWIEMGRANVILDNLIAEGKVKPMIVVMETSVAPGPAGARAVAEARAWAPQMWLPASRLVVRAVPAVAAASTSAASSSFSSMI